MDGHVDMEKRDKEWAQLSGCFLVSNVTTRRLAPMPAGVGTARDILKQVSSTSPTLSSSMTLRRSPTCPHSLDFRSLWSLCPALHHWFPSQWLLLSCFCSKFLIFLISLQIVFLLVHVYFCPQSLSISKTLLSLV